MGFGGFRRFYQRNIFFQLEKYFFPSEKKSRALRNLQTCKTCSPLTPTHAHAYNKVNFDFQLARSITFLKKIKLSSIICAACKAFTKRHRFFYSLSKRRDTYFGEFALLTGTFRSFSIFITALFNSSPHARTCVGVRRLQVLQVCKLLRSMSYTAFNFYGIPKL